jgi:ribonuclease Z
MDLDVVFLGTAGSAPTAARGLPATLIRRGGERLLVDCGEGTQRQLLRSVGLVDLEEIFLTHFHADHLLGLPGMLKTFGLRGREAPLTIYGPPGLRALIGGVLHPLIGRTPFELHVVELEPNEELERDGYRIAAFNVRHRVQAYGYALVEDERPGRFDEQAALELGVKPGPDFGRLQHGETVTSASGAEVTPNRVLGAPRAGRKIVLSGDTAPCEMTAVVAHGADLLVHEATFGDEEADRARETGHTTARGAAELAAEADVTLLALTHLSPRHPAGALRAEAREVFDNTIVPRDFDRVDVPLPEKGEPIHVRVRDEPAADLAAADARTQP